MQTIVQLQHLSHRYSQQWAIKDINFDIHRQGILGLLGSNGAGKSTTMNILCGVLSQTAGNVIIDGIDIRKAPGEAKKRIGFLPQQAPLHLEQTVDEYLTFCAHIRLVPKKEIRSAVEAVKERCGVAHFSKRQIGNLSGGYRQRVGIAQAIIHRPLLVVLDEPTNGLDPNQILEVRQLIKEIAAERSVIFSSHILAEVQATCNDIIMIEGGQVVFQDTMQAFNNYIAPDSLMVTFENPPSTGVLQSVPGITKVERIEDKTYRMHFTDATGISEKVVVRSVEEGWRLTEINLEKSSLDAIFAQLSNKRSTQKIA